MNILLLLCTNSSRLMVASKKPCVEKDSMGWPGLSRKECHSWQIEDICHEDRKCRTLGFALPNIWNTAKTLTWHRTSRTGYFSSCISCLWSHKLYPQFLIFPPKHESSTPWLCSHYFFARNGLILLPSLLNPLILLQDSGWMSPFLEEFPWICQV